LHGFHLLVAQEAAGMVLEAAALQAGSGPAAIEVGPPIVELDTLRSSHFSE
jgi:hypothetical protein